MSIRIVPFEPGLVDTVAAFSARTWSRPRTREYVEWRYLDAPFLRGQLALDGQECLAAVWAFERRYRFGGETRITLETHDWFCRPDLRGSGLGIRVMQTMMRTGDPIVTVGGTADTLGLLPRLGWQKAGIFTSYVLPLGGRTLAAALGRRLGMPTDWLAPVIGVAVRMRATPKPRLAADEEVIEVRTPDPALLALGEASLQGIASLTDPRSVEWLFRSPPVMGRFRLIAWRRGGRTVGWSLSRVYEADGRREASLIELRCEEPSSALCETLIGHTIARLLPERPDVVRAGTSAPHVESALRRWRFLTHERVPIHVRPAGALPEGPHSIGNDIGDLPLVPYPER